MTAKTWRWVAKNVVLALHEAQLAEHGGMQGTRDEGLIESALARPRNKSVYETPDIADLAASYAYGLLRDHGFIDGNKRTAFLVALVFIMDNGKNLAAPHDETLAVMLDSAAGTLNETELAAWFRRYLIQPTNIEETNTHSRIYADLK
jgi:death-on-curing protein